MKRLGLTLILIGAVYGGLLVWAVAGMYREASSADPLWALGAMATIMLGYVMLTAPTRRR